MKTHTTNDTGSALIMSLLIVIALSIVGAGMTVLSLSETYGSMNYRLMSQARYGAESGVHAAANFILNNYVPPGDDPADPLASYVLTASPITANGTAVVLSAVNSVTPNYPIGAKQAGFLAAAAGSLVTGDANVQYSASARLVAMRQVDVYGSLVPRVIQTWELTGTGSTTGARNAQVEVTATLERQVTPTFKYAVFSTNNGCGSLKFSGGSDVDSYDSQNLIMANGHVQTQQFMGNVGSNGNLNESGGANVYGTMSTPRTGVGLCSNGGVAAWTQNGNNTNVTGGLVHLPQELVFDPPTPPNPLPPTTNLNLTKNSGCGGTAGCTLVDPATGALAFTPGSYGNLKLSGQAVVHLTTGVYNFNSVTLSGNSQIIVDSSPVIVNIAGQSTTSPLDLSGGTLANASYDPRGFQVMYAGTQQIKLTGGTEASGVIYAPKAPVDLSGGTDWYGSIVASQFTASGGMSVHNDRQLANEFMNVTNPMLGAFSWKKY